MILTKPIELVTIFKKIYLLLNNHKNFCDIFLYFLSVNNDNKCLPLILWLRKNTTKVRFLIAALVSSTKPPWKSLTSMFKLFLKQIGDFNKQSRFFVGINTF